MKKFVITGCIFLVIIFSSDAYAGIGFKGGLNYAKWSGNGLVNADDYSWKTGIKLGAYYVLPVCNIFKIQPEIFYSTKGWKYVYVGHSADESLSLNYITISVLAKFIIETGEAFKPTIFTGPYMGYFLNAKAKMNIGGKSMSANLSDDLFKSTEMGWVVGGGFDFEIAVTTFTLEARYCLGMTQVLNMEGNIASVGHTPVFNTDGDVKNKTFSIIGGMSF